MSEADKIKNAAEKAAGKLKESAGKIAGDKSLEAEGKTDQTKASLNLNPPVDRWWNRDFGLIGFLGFGRG